MRYKEIRDTLAASGVDDPAGEAALLLRRYYGLTPAEIEIPLLMWEMM
jgi:hypothetical protein